MRTFTFFALVALQAQGAFMVCNQTAETIDTAYAVYYLSMKRDPVTFAQVPQFESHGWVVLKPGQCGKLDHSGYRRVWIAGFGSNGSEWGGVGNSPTFCVDPAEEFHFDEGRFPEIHRSERACKAQGGKLVAFAAHFGGMEHYTVNFTPGPATRKDDSIPTTPPSRKVYDPDNLEPSPGDNSEPSFVPERKRTTPFSPPLNARSSQVTRSPAFSAISTRVDQ